MTKISVIVPVYNSIKLIDKCLRSLVSQTLKDLEIIVVDDGSNDGSTEKIKEYAKNYSNIVPIFQANAGISAARNRGLDKAKGEFVTFLDSDDYIDTDAYEIIYDYMISNNVDIAVCDYFKEYSDGSKVEEKLFNFPISSIDERPHLLFYINMGPWNKVYKRSLFKKVRFPKIKYEDFAIMPELLIEAKRIGKINKSFNYYYIRENGETGIVDKRVFDILINLKNINEFLEKKGFFKRHYREVEYFNIERLMNYVIQQRMNKNKKVADKFINESYEYLDSMFPNWRKNEYFKREKFLKKLIYKYKGITIVYCDLYRKFRSGKNEKIR